MATNEFFLWLLCCMCVAFTLTCAEHSSDDTVAVDCSLDDDYTNPQLQRCLDLGKDFVHNYVKMMKRKKPFHDKCSQYKKLRDCLLPLLNQCPAIRHTYHRHWSPIIEEMDCECISPNAECMARTNCTNVEIKGVMARICDNFYKFNELQKSKASPCHLLHEHIWCRQNLVATACGEKAGYFIFHMMKLHYQRKLHREGCELRKNHGFTLFGYSDQCPRDFADRIQQCINDHLTVDDVLNFREDNIVVSSEGPGQVKKSCRAVKNFHECVRPIKDNCPHGTRLIHASEGPLRTYLLKMDYICQDENKQQYIASLKCYREALDNKVLQFCNTLWNDLKPWRANITSFNFFCQKDHHLTVGMTQELQKLQLCIVRVFNESCGINASNLIGGLISRTLSDPYPLVLDYIPDCHLHDPPPTTTPTSTTTTTTTTVVTTSATQPQSTPSQVAPTKRKSTSKPQYRGQISGSSKLSLHWSILCCAFISLVLRTVLSTSAFSVR